jgi:peptidoglycan/LPS O-acetylase OafA/YrhL
VIKSRLAGTWSWPDYGINRATRLYVVLIPGLLFGLLWDVLGGSLLATKGIYTHPVADLGPAIAADNLTAGNFIGNLFYLQTIFCSTFGSNGPLWSLANEFWYYALFPVALAAGIAWARRSMRTVIPLAALVFCLCFFLGLEKLIGFLIWISGCALVFAYSRMRLRAQGVVIVYMLASSVILGGCLLAARTVNGSALGSDLAVGIAFTLFLFGILQFEAGAGSPSYANTGRFFAGFSYSLYVLHFPLLLFLRAWIVPEQRWQPTAANCALGLLIGAGVLIFAWLVSRFTENKTHVARDWVRRTLGQSR